MAKEHENGHKVLAKSGGTNWIEFCWCFGSCGTRGMLYRDSVSCSHSVCPVFGCRCSCFSVTFNWTCILSLCSSCGLPIIRIYIYICTEVWTHSYIHPCVHAYNLFICRLCTVWSPFGRSSKSLSSCEIPFFRKNLFVICRVQIVEARSVLLAERGRRSSSLSVYSSINVYERIHTCINIYFLVLHI